ncbi:hypothetical protein EW145_g2358 [Phellinidium pouzarii]|uniref:FAD-binding domain-containing protein n=1 Tax=Phellinidium pouzarii TaxID=167371 RepID=A0A4S4LCR3_9AGAM|nr:hypothetical protein EW145_g2358 [Phellinidium pouzarii]
MPFPTAPVKEDLFRRRAEVALDFVVVGGSIAGLSCAYNLNQAGHNVRVLERSSGPGIGTGGLRVPPNMTKLLFHWGLGAQLVKLAVKCPRIEFLESTTGEYLSGLVMHEEVMAELQADMYGMLYSDLHLMLYDLAVAAGVRVDFNVNVVDVDVSEPSVLLASGQRLQADIVIGADGPQGISRERVFGPGEKFKIGPFTGYTLIRILWDPKLRSLVDDEMGLWKVWMGAHRCVLTFFVCSDQYAVQLICPSQEAVHNWTKSMPLLPTAEKFDDFEETVQRLLRLVTQTVETQNVIQESTSVWYDKDGHVVLIGDAAHLLNPGTTHGSSLAMEDAAVLGSLFSRLRSRDKGDIMRLLAAYQEIREDRCVEVNKSEFGKCAISTIAPGDPMYEVRNAGFAASREVKALDWENLGDPYLQNVWEEFKGSFGYEAYDAADDWWVDWGILTERLAAAPTMVVTSAAEEDNDELVPAFDRLGLTSHVVVTSVTQDNGLHR